MHHNQGFIALTHWGRDKMAAISRRHFQMYFLEWKCVNFEPGCRMAPLRTRKGIDTTKIDKNPARVSYMAVRGRMGPLRSQHGLFKGCLGSQNPYGVRKLIMHALKLYGPRTGTQNSYGAAHGPREWTYNFCSKQPVNSLNGARECNVTEALGKSMLCVVLLLCSHDFRHWPVWLDTTRSNL